MVMFPEALPSKLFSFFVNMPSVVGDQEAKFESDDFFKNLNKPLGVRYTSHLNALPEERRLRFLDDCHNHKILDIAILPSGLNLELHFSPRSPPVSPFTSVIVSTAAAMAASAQQPSSSSDPDSAMPQVEQSQVAAAASSGAPASEQLQTAAEAMPATPQADFIDLHSDAIKVYLCSHFILNGVCVRWRGWIDRVSLAGEGIIEFDAVRAERERQRLQEDLLNLQRRIEAIRQYQQQRQFEAMQLQQTSSTSSDRSGAASLTGNTSEATTSTTANKPAAPSRPKQITIWSPATQMVPH